MKTIEVDYDPRVWAEVPLQFPSGTYETQDDWAEALADAYSGGRENAEVWSSDLEMVARVLPVEDRQGLVQVLWYMPDAEIEPLLVNIHVASADGVEHVRLTELAGAYDDEPVGPPAVDTLPSRAFGSVARVLSHFEDEVDGRRVMRLCAVGRRDGVIVRLDAVTSDLENGRAAVGPFTGLMENVSVRDD